MKNKAKVIVFSGPDASGKETQSNLMFEYLRSKNLKVVKFEIPEYSTYTGNLIKKMLFNGMAEKCPYTFQFIQFLNKISFQKRVLEKEIENNDYVILDRWSLSSVVYGLETNLKKWYVKFLFNLLFKPNLTLIFYGPSFSKLNKDVYESNTEFQKRIRNRYFEISKEINNTQVIEYEGKTKGEIFELVKSTLELQGIL